MAETNSKKKKDKKLRCKILFINNRGVAVDFKDNGILIETDKKINKVPGESIDVFYEGTPFKKTFKPYIK